MQYSAESFEQQQFGTAGVEGVKKEYGIVTESEYAKFESARIAFRPALEGSRQLQPPPILTCRADRSVADRRPRTPALQLVPSTVSRSNRFTTASCVQREYQQQQKQWYVTAACPLYNALYTVCQCVL